MDDTKQIEELMIKLKTLSEFRGYVECVLEFSIWKDGQQYIGVKREKISKVIEDKRKEKGIQATLATVVYIDFGLNKLANETVELLDKGEL